MALCRAALQRGLAGLTFTEHLDTEPSDPGYGYYDFDLLRRDVEEARRAFAGRLELYIGAEVCYQPPFAQRVADLAQVLPLDYVIGSVHYVHHEFIDPSFFRRRPVEEAYDSYFEAVEETVQSGLFDALGHLDVAKRYAVEDCGPFDPQRHWGQIERILRLMIERDVALEFNTSGWRQPPKAPYPDEAILRRYVELGGRRVTLGADAHYAVHVGFEFARAADMLRRVGLTHLTHFVGRKPRFYPL